MKPLIIINLINLLCRRCRSAFKLIEINERSKILQPGHTVIDCGASPGSWTEIAVQETNANGKQKNKPKGFVIGLDLLSIHPIEVGRASLIDFVQFNPMFEV